MDCTHAFGRQQFALFAVNELDGSINVGFVPIDGEVLMILLPFKESFLRLSNRREYPRIALVVTICSNSWIQKGKGIFTSSHLTQKRMDNHTTHQHISLSPSPSPFLSFSLSLSLSLSHTHTDVEFSGVVIAMVSAVEAEDGVVRTPRDAHPLRGSGTHSQRERGPMEERGAGAGERREQHRERENEITRSQINQSPNS